jgi:hypothetical protein
MAWSESARLSGSAKVNRIEAAKKAVKAGLAVAVLEGDLWTVTDNAGEILFSETISDARKVEIDKSLGVPMTPKADSVSRMPYLAKARLGWR